MFEAVLITYMLGIGKDFNQGASLAATPFQTMAQCEEVVKHIDDVIDDWHYGKDKKKTVPILKSAKCFPIKSVPLDIPMPSYTSASVTPYRSTVECSPTAQLSTESYKLPALPALPSLNGNR